jgi:acyl-CoA thioester hydrolase
VSAFEWPVRVYFEDTDAGGIVYHASYLRFAERARTEWLRALGFGQREMAERFGCIFAVRRCSLDYRRPARLDDALVVVTRPGDIGGARLALAQEVRRGAELLVGLEVELALLGPDYRPARLPAPLRAALQSVTQTTQAA